MLIPTPTLIQNGMSVFFPREIGVLQSSQCSDPACSGLPPSLQGKKTWVNNLLSRKERCCSDNARLTRLLATSLWPSRRDLNQEKFSPGGCMIESFIQWSQKQKQNTQKKGKGGRKSRMWHIMCHCPPFPILPRENVFYKNNPQLTKWQ